MPWEPVEADPEKGKDEKKDGVEAKISLDGLFQVMSMGAGAPMLGDLKKTNFNKPESEGGAALQFELEANNCACRLHMPEHALVHGRERLPKPMSPPSQF